MTQDTKQIDAAIEDLNYPNNPHTFICGLKSENFKTILTALQLAKRVSEIDWEGMEMLPDSEVKDGPDFDDGLIYGHNQAINTSRKAVMGDE